MTGTNENPERTERALLPCQNCGYDLGRDSDVEETRSEIVVEENAFLGQDAVREVPAWVCPECNEVTPL